MDAQSAQPAQPSRPAQPAASLEYYRKPLEALLGQIIDCGRFNLTFAIKPFESPEKVIEDPEWLVEFAGPDADLLLEANAELLNALEYVVLKAVRLPEELFTKVTFDCEEWRRLRIEELKLMAEVAADRVLESGDPFPLGPMSARERRVVHLALRDRPEVRTESQGYGPERKVMILPASGGDRGPVGRRRG